MLQFFRFYLFHHWIYHFVSLYVYLIYDSAINKNRNEYFFPLLSVMTKLPIYCTVMQWMYSENEQIHPCVCTVCVVSVCCVCLCSVVHKIRTFVWPFVLDKIHLCASGNYNKQRNGPFSTPFKTFCPRNPFAPLQLSP